MLAESFEYKLQRLQRLSEDLDNYDQTELFRMLFSWCPIGALVTKAEGSILRVNRALIELLGYTQPYEPHMAEFRDKGWHWLTHPDDLALDVGYAQRAAAWEIDGYYITKRYRGPNDRWVWVRLKIQFYEDQIHGPLAIVYVTPAPAGIDMEANVDVFEKT